MGPLGRQRTGRKQKKSVLMNVKKLLRYRATLQLYRALEAHKFSNPRILERMERLKAKLAEQEKFLPNAKNWEHAVKRAKK